MSAPDSSGPAAEAPTPYRLWLREIAYNCAMAHREQTGGIVRTEIKNEGGDTAVRGVVLADAFLSTCIETTRVLVETYTLLGLRARAIAVDVTAFNAAAAPIVINGTPVTQDLLDAGAYTVGVDHRNPPPGSPADGRPRFNGHMVCVVTNPASEVAANGARTIIDATADQFHRPAKGLRVAPIVLVNIPSGRPWTPQDPLYTPPDLSDREAGILAYSPIPPGAPESKSFRETEAWNTPLIPPLAREIAEQAPDCPVPGIARVIEEKAPIR